MSADANRLAHLKRLVEVNSPPKKDGSLDLKEGYRAVAAATGLKYDYIYQLYTGKSGKNLIGRQALKRISDAYAEGRPDGWMDLPLHETDDDAFDPVRPPTLNEALERLVESLAGLDDIGREMVANALSLLAKNPDQAERLVSSVSSLVQTHTQQPTPPDTPAPSTRRPAKTTAHAAKPTGRAELVLKIGGGQKQQFSLPLVREAFKGEAAASPNEQEWYRRIANAPKAKS